MPGANHDESLRAQKSTTLRLAGCHPPPAKLACKKNYKKILDRKRSLNKNEEGPGGEGDSKRQRAGSRALRVFKTPASDAPRGGAKKLLE